MYDDDKDRRPPIPAELKRRVLVEAGHRCAIPTCRHIEVDIHHIIPWATCRAHEYENLIALCPNCHRRAGRDEIDRKSLRAYKANLRFTHDRFSQFEVDVLFATFNAEAGRYLTLPPFSELFFIRLLDAGYVKLGIPSQRLYINEGGFHTDPLGVCITESGRKYINDLGLNLEDA